MRGFKKVITTILSLTIVFAVVGCSNSKVSFDGSKTSNDDSFLVDFQVLDTKVYSIMHLSQGDIIETTIDIEKGSVDILVESENGIKAYRGDEVESGSFVIEITEAGTYTFSVSGNKAAGSVHFVKASVEN